MNPKVLALLLPFFCLYQCKSSTNKTKELDDLGDSTLFGLFKNFKMPELLQIEALKFYKTLSPITAKDIKRGVNGRTMYYQHGSKTFALENLPGPFESRPRLERNSLYALALRTHLEHELHDKPRSDFEKLGLSQVKTRLLPELEKEASTEILFDLTQGRAFFLKVENKFVTLERSNDDDKLHQKLTSDPQEASHFTLSFDHKLYRTCLAYVDHEQEALRMLSLGKKLELKDRCNESSEIAFIYEGKKKIRLAKPLGKDHYRGFTLNSDELSLKDSMNTKFNSDQIVTFSYEFINSVTN